jgi:uracil-DNA glycosylase family 4
MASKSELLQQLKAECIACRKCDIGGCVYADCPGNVFSNMCAKAHIMVVGQNPGAVEVKTGKPFVGPSGANFDTALKEVLNIDRTELYITNSVRCFSPGNRAPFPHEVENCRPYLDREVEIMKPVIFLALGASALYQLTGVRGSRSMENNQGKILQSPRYETPVLALYHPSPMNWNNPERKAAIYKGLELLRTYLWILQPNE